MGTVVTKSFKIKTGENSFSEPINFLSESVFFRDGENLDSHLGSLNNKIDKEIKDEQTARQNEDSALGDRVDALSTSLTNNISTLTGLINTEASTRKDADKAINDTIKSLKDNDISQINKNISALQTTTNENKTNISSLEIFIKGKNTTEENIPGLVDQVATNATKVQENYDAIEALKIPVNANTTKTQENYNAIEALKALVGAGSLEEGAPNLLNIINSLESRISVLEGLVLTAPDEPEIPEEPIE